MLARLRSTHPEHRAILSGMTRVMIFVFLGKIAGAVKEMAVSHRYGVGPEVDAYLYVYNLVTWPVAVWFSVLTVVLVPLAARIRHQARDDLAAFRAELFGLTSILALLIAGLALPSLVWLLNSPMSGLTVQTSAFALENLPPLLLLLPFGMLISLFSAWLMAAGQHLNSLLEGLPPFVIACVVLAYSGADLEILANATLGGFALQLCGLVIALCKTRSIETPRFRMRSTQWPLFWQGFGVMLIGQALMSLLVIIDQFFAAHLGTGAIATIGYANRILSLILGLGATAIGRATLPVFSRVGARDNESIHRIAYQWAALLFVLGLLGMIIGYWIAPWIVSLLFEHGAFTAQDTRVVAETFRYGLLQLPFYFSGAVFVSLLTSQACYGVITVVGAINLVIKTVANFLLVHWIGVNGIMLSTGIMFLFSTLLLALAFHFGVGWRKV